MTRYRGCFLWKSDSRVRTRMGKWNGSLILGLCCCLAVLVSSAMAQEFPEPNPPRVELGEAPMGVQADLHQAAPTLE